MFSNALNAWSGSPNAPVPKPHMIPVSATSLGPTLSNTGEPLSPALAPASTMS